MAFIWGIPYLFIKIAVGELTPATLVFLRSLDPASTLSPVALARKEMAPLRPYWKWILAADVGRRDMMVVEPPV